jgi:hypothetical protein
VANTTFDGFLFRPYPTGADYTFATYIHANAANCKLLNNKVVGMGTGSRIVGFHIRGNNSIVEGNEISSISHEGITYYTTTSLAGLCRHNYCHSWHDHTVGRGGADGIKVTGSGDFTGLILEYNEITGWLDDGIDFYGGNNVVARYNYVHDPAVGHYGNGFNMGGGSGTASNNIAYGNYVVDLINGTLNRGIISNNNTPNQIWAYNVVINAEVGLWVYGTSHNCLVFNNYVESRDRAIMVSSGAQDTKLYNNIMDGGSYDLRVESSTTTSGAKNIHVNYPATHDGLNTKYDTSNDYFQQDPGIDSITWNAGAKLLDFILNSDSFCLNKGTTWQTLLGLIDGRIDPIKWIEQQEYDYETTDRLNIGPTQVGSDADDTVDGWNLQAQGISTSQIKATWDAQDGADGYELRYRKS